MNFVIGIAKIVAIIVTVFIVCELYDRFRKRINRPKIGVELLINLLHRGDYVSIDGKIHRFSHIANSNETINHLAFPCEENKTMGGELAFENDRGLGYIFFYPSAMIKCDFIFGKYGLKWARNNNIANNAKEYINKFRHV